MPGVLAENAKTGDDNCTKDGTVTILTSNCIMLLPAPQMSNKSRFKKGNALNYLAFIFQIGSLHDPVTWYKIKNIGEQVAQ